MSRGEREVRGRKGERKTEIREKGRRQDDAERKEKSQRTQTRKSEGDGNEEEEGETGQIRTGKLFFCSEGRSTVNHSFIPSAVYPLPYCLHMNKGCVILIKRNRVTAVPSV